MKKRKCLQPLRHAHSSMRIKRALKLGQVHRLDTRFYVKDGKKTVAYGKSKPIELSLKQKKDKEGKKDKEEKIEKKNEKKEKV